MRRAHERVDADLDAERHVPQHVQDSAGREHRDAGDPGRVPGRHRAAPPGPPAARDHGRRAQQEGQRRKASVERGMPRREERVEPTDVQVCPPVRVDRGHDHEPEDGGTAVERPNARLLQSSH